MAELGKFSFGTGDRFGKEGKAQLEAIIKIQKDGVAVTPVWNKSNREHQTVNTQPKSVLEEADNATTELNFTQDYFVDADHINKETVDPFLNNSNFFTIDVTNYINKKSDSKNIRAFKEFFQDYLSPFKIEGIIAKIDISEAQFQEMTNTFLFAMKKASEVYFHIKSNKEDTFYTEVSIDEVENPQTPTELFFVLSALAFYKVPVTTIAPKFTGNFYKGIDYEGDLEQFNKEFEADLCVLKFVKTEFGLPEELKLSVHSGSDKFSIYPIINKLIKKHNSGLHLKTAGTTWLEEAIGLAESGGKAFEFIQQLYTEALDRYDELTENYTEVLDIDKEKLPQKNAFETGEVFAEALRHDSANQNYNPHFRQLMHCAYKIAGEKDEFYSLLDSCRNKIEENVTFNLYQRHLVPLFINN
ncbi:tagaturonate epimerase family protein [Zunongwangia endophytica]|uniref:Tagaturonate/fructuronate epimerase n=1 Tax=Zunongwangia endophytica TaxID=1808945 RepID=A0ABV8H9N6_9FLAO|nr:tagaturonate epimerase family protein [Zunongwangia endophytica]MDN3594876.1 tagaturonate epimerase family protein [Zunongwangia endophytica]